MSSARRKVMVLGSGAREHALAKALLRSPSVARVLVAPGNGGLEEGGEPVGRAPLDIANHAAVVELARSFGADLVVVGPENPLVAGVVVALAEKGILAFGPSREAALLEASKAFLK